MGKWNQALCDPGHHGGWSPEFDMRLVKRLIAAQRYPEARQWIQEGLDALQGKWPGVVSDLRAALRTIHSEQKDWQAVAALQAEEYVLHPSTQTYSDCQRAVSKVKTWSKVRLSLLTYLEKGKLPWEQKGWPLDATDLKPPKTDSRDRFPMLSHLIDIAILEKKPDQVLHWYDSQPKARYWGHSINEDKIATAVQTHAPDRAVAIWQHMAETLVAQTKPRAYEEAAQYLRKAGAVMAKQKKKTKWAQYMQTLRQTHARKRRFVEILDGLNREPIVKKK